MCKEFLNYGSSLWSRLRPVSHPDLLPRAGEIAASEMFPFPSQSATFSQTDRAAVIKWVGGDGGRELEQYFKASWPAFDPLFLQVC